MTAQKPFAGVQVLPIGARSVTNATIATTTDSQTQTAQGERQRRRDVGREYLYLGKHSTAEAQERYDRLIADWLAEGRRATGDEHVRLVHEKASAEHRRTAEQVAEVEIAVTVDEVLAAYWGFAETHYTGRRCVS